MTSRAALDGLNGGGMKATWFRFVDESGNSSGFMGLALAHTDAELFWEIDQYGDPYMVQVQQAVKGGFCTNAEGTDVETSGQNPDCLDPEGWVLPSWCRKRGTK